MAPELTGVTRIPPEYHDLFEKPTIAHVVTMTSDGKPHSTPVWIDYDADADRLLVNTERGRRKARNVAGDPTVAVSMTDPDDLAGRYMGEAAYPNPVRTERVLFRIRADEVITSG